MKLSDVAENQHLLKVPKYPQQVMLDGGFYMEQGNPYGDSVIWFVHRLMEDEGKMYGIARQIPSSGQWSYRAFVDPANDKEDMVHAPKSTDFFDLDKFKSFVNDCLRKDGQL